jgi:arylsulfatase A-like enzyme
MQSPNLLERILLAGSSMGFLWIMPSASSAAEDPSAAASKPNIVFILSDDVGYGDVGCYGATRVKTPNIDRMAAEGLRFTDAHCTASTCTPSRYSIITGLYAWRKKGTGVLPGNAACIIPAGSVTLASQMKRAGYTTGAVGKWHLGLGEGKLDWNGEIKPGPLELGFDTCFIIPATGDRVPTVFVKDHRVADLDPNDPLVVSYGIKVGDEPTGKEHPELLKMKLSVGHDGTIVNGISRIGFEAGGHAARWKDDKIAIDLTNQATSFIETNQNHPFFLYFATHDIHVPRVPNQRFAGTSKCGVRGDAIAELDWSVGEIEAALARLNLTRNTLVIFSSDNGPVVDDGYADGSVEALGDHKPSGPWRGGKYDIYEGGTREPFIVDWPGTVQPGVTDVLVSQVDLLASLSTFTHTDLPASAGADSVDVLPALLGQSKNGRTWVVEESNGIALRMGNWKLIPPYLGRDILIKDEEARPRAMRGMKIAQLFDLAKDPGESTNVAADHPDVVKRMTDLLTAISAQKSSATRPPQ